MYCILLLLLLNFHFKLRMYPDSVGLMIYQYINKLSASIDKMSEAFIRKNLTASSCG